MTTDKLIYVGDKVVYKQDVKRISSINAILRDYYSTEESNLSGNANLQYSRISSRFRVSSNDSLYSDWYNLKDFEIANVKTWANVYVDSNASTNVEIEFKLLNIPLSWDEDIDYVQVSNVSVQVSSFASESGTVIDPPPPQVSSVGNDQGIEYHQNFYYNPYDMQELERTQVDLSFMTNEIYGHKVDYVKVTSNTDKGSDFTLREWNLFTVKQADVKCIKVIVPDNQFPDNKFSFNPFGVDFGDAFEIHIVDAYFKKMFGAGYFPQEHDFLYFPLVNRMYEVMSTYLFRDFNMQPLYWKLTLTKWEKRSNVIWEDETQKLEIEDSIKGLDSVFLEDTEDEAQDLLNKSQFRFQEESLDIMRSYINQNLLFDRNKIENYFTTVSDSQYNLNSLYVNYVDPKLAVVYKKQFAVESDKTTMLTFWAKSNKVISNSYNCSVALFSTGIWNITLTTGNYPTHYNVGNRVSTYQRTSNGKTFLHLFEITGINIDRNVITVKLFDTTENVDVSKIDLVSFAIEKTVITSGFNNYSILNKSRDFTQDTGTDLFRVFIADQYSLNLEYFGTNYAFKFTENLSDEIYYAFVISFNNTFRQLGAYVYKVRGGNINAELETVDYYTRLGFGNNSKTTTNVLNLVASPLSLTNIRLVTEHVEQDIHSAYLSRYIINNDSESIIVDNALENIDLKDIK